MSILKSQKDTDYNEMKEEVDQLNRQLGDLSQVLHLSAVAPSHMYDV